MSWSGHKWHLTIPVKLEKSMLLLAFKNRLNQRLAQTITYEKLFQLWVV